LEAILSQPNIHLAKFAELQFIIQIKTNLASQGGFLGMRASLLQPNIHLAKFAELQLTILFKTVVF
jgi:hypothetical protein